MIEPLQYDPASCLLFAAGEEVLCTLCRKPLLIIERDIFGPGSGETVTSNSRPTPRARLEWSAGALRVFCWPCGGDAGAAPSSTAGRLPSDESAAARVLIRSQGWVGWRRITGE